MTIPKDDHSQSRKRFDKVLKVIELQLKTLEQAEASVETIATLKQLLRHLRGLKEPLLSEILSVSEHKGKRTENPPRHSELDDAAISDLSLDGVETLINDSNITVLYLRRIAVSRFALPPGTLPKLSRDRLIEKIRNCIENERTHDTISRLAGKP